MAAKNPRPSAPQPRDRGAEAQRDALVLPLGAIDASMLAAVGGKAANLGELERAGLPVPAGFCLSTAAYAAVAEGARLEPIVDELAGVPADDADGLNACAGAARERLLAAAVPSAVAEALVEGYRHFGADEPVPVAVRSSATAEDLPFASFAGQQDTYLNVLGEAPVVDAARRCWASLWTDRAVAYRARNGIDQHTVRLAVVVQRMVDARVAGVLFTANPLSGRRHEAVIDASPGLGEAVVSGAVNPDHFVVDSATGEIRERRLGDKRVFVRAASGGGTERIESASASTGLCLTDAEVLALARLGERVDARYRAPQDIEWALAVDGRLWLTQARPITTLYPLPDGSADGPLRVWFSFNVAQGVYRPLTPMGLQALAAMGSSVATRLGVHVPDPLGGPPAMAVAGSRLFLDVAPLLRSPRGRSLLLGALGFAEARTSTILERLVAGPRIALGNGAQSAFLLRLAWVLVRQRVPIHLAQAVLRPAAARARVWRFAERLRAAGAVRAGASAGERLDAVERLLGDASSIPLAVGPAGVPAFAALGLAARLLGDRASAADLQTVLRGLPHNPTTAMDLALWRVSTYVRADATAARVLLDAPLDDLVERYRAGSLPSTIQRKLEDFITSYGHRGVAEIDIGMPRWGDDPSHILGVLANYLRLDDPTKGPDTQFKRGAREAEAMLVELSRRAGHGPLGWARARLVALCLQRTRALAGVREIPKHHVVVVLASARQLLVAVGQELASADRLASAEDIFFIDLGEARRALAGVDLRALVSERRADYDRELGRRHVPRVLLSDGTEPEATAHSATPSVAEGLVGTPASPGTVTAIARVIREPVGARLEPGEILVAPSTDPGWTPLFLTAGGLVMEMGGAISHGAVVAREYGIPAVVGVAAATERISSGDRITVDGAAGTVTLEP